MTAMIPVNVEHWNSDDFIACDGEIRVLSRALSILECLAASNHRLPLVEIARNTNLDKSTVLRLVRYLAARKYVHKDDADKTYSLGFSVFQLGRKDYASSLVRLHAHKFLTDIAGIYGVVCTLAAFEGSRILVIDRIEANRDFKSQVRVGNYLPSYATALGKAILAFKPPKLVEELYRHHRFQRYTDRTIGSLAQLSSELKAIRQCGFAESRGEYESHISSMAVPIINPMGDVTFSIGISLRSARYANSGRDGLAEMLTQASRNIATYIVGAPLAEAPGVGG